MTAGRMAVIQDPQGAYFLVWEPRDHIGAGLVNVPGTICLERARLSRHGGLGPVLR